MYYLPISVQSLKKNDVFQNDFERRTIMMSTHLTLSDRKDIENLLKEGKSFKEIGKILGKDCTTISKEVRRHRVERKTGAFGQSYNACKYRTLYVRIVVVEKNSV
jgi:IS30 family transposase